MVGLIDGGVLVSPALLPAWGRDLPGIVAAARDAGDDPRGAVSLARLAYRVDAETLVRLAAAATEGSLASAVSFVDGVGRQSALVLIACITDARLREAWIGAGRALHAYEWVDLPDRAMAAARDARCQVSPQDRKRLDLLSALLWGMDECAPIPGKVTHPARVHPKAGGFDTRFRLACLSIAGVVGGILSGRDGVCPLWFQHRLDAIIRWHIAGEVGSA